MRAKKYLASPVLKYLYQKSSVSDWKTPKRSIICFAHNKAPVQLAVIRLSLIHICGSSRRVLWGECKAARRRIAAQIPLHNLWAVRDGIWPPSPNHNINIRKEITVYGIYKINSLAGRNHSTGRQIHLPQSGHVRSNRIRYHGGDQFSSRRRLPLHHLLL